MPSLAVLLYAALACNSVHGDAPLSRCMLVSSSGPRRSRYSSAAAHQLPGHNRHTRRTVAHGPMLLPSPWGADAGGWLHCTARMPLLAALCCSSCLPAPSLRAWMQ